MGLNKLNHNYNESLVAKSIVAESVNGSSVKAKSITTDSLNGLSSSDITSLSVLSIVQAKTSAYTFSSGDKNKFIELNGTFTVSIPTDQTFNFEIGTQINILNIGTGVITIAAVDPSITTVNATPSLILRAQWSGATLIKRAANTWVVAGDLKS